MSIVLFHIIVYKEESLKAFSTDTRFLSGLFLKKLIRLAGNSQQQMWFVWNTKTKSQVVVAGMAEQTKKRPDSYRNFFRRKKASQSWT